MIKSILCLFLFTLPAYSQVNYTYKREVTVRAGAGTIVRRSTFTFNDQMERVETDVTQSGNGFKLTKDDWARLREPRILSNGDVMAEDSGDSIWTNEALRTTIWGGNSFLLPERVEATGRFKNTIIVLRIRYYDYKVFRGALVGIKEVDE